MLKRDTEELVLEYCQTRDLELRDAITIQLSGLVESIARKFIGSGEPIEDLIQEGYLGLLNALDLFKPEKGVKFTTYATHLIVGQIKHYLRDKGKIIKEPAWLQELNSKINRVVNELSARYGRPPTTQEVAEFLGMTTKAVEDVLMTREVFKVSSLDAIYEDEEEEWNGYDLEKLNCEPCQTFNLPIEERVVVETAMRQLKQIEQQVLHLFFEEGYNQTEIAHQLKISCNYVSHILRNATQKLRRIISEAEWIDEQRFRARALARGDFEARIWTRRRGCSRRTTSPCACARRCSAPHGTTRPLASPSSSSRRKRAHSMRWASSRLASCCCRQRQSCARRCARRTSWGATDIPLWGF
jgi:RNA polymerase sigma factor (sigma-70 family)